MMFGNAAPKFQVSAVDVLLDHAIIEVDKTDEKTIVHESELNRARTVITKPEHHTFQVLIHLHDYVDPKTKFDEITAHQGSKVVRIWRHRDGVAFREDGTSNDADFHFISYQEINITTTGYADGLRLFFRSIDVIDHSHHGDGYTFARALTSGSSNAWYKNANGFLVEADDIADSRRLEAGKVNGTSIRLEDADTNQIDRPSDVAHASWLKNQISTTTSNTNDTKDPTGITNNAAKLVTIDNTSEWWFDLGLTGASDRNAGVWLKSNLGNLLFKIQIRGATTGTIERNITITPTWQWFVVSGNTTGHTGNAQFRIRSDEIGAETIYHWGAQMASGLVASMIVDPVATTDTTRAIESLLRDEALDLVTSGNKFTVRLWFKANYPVSGSFSQIRTLWDIEGQGGRVAALQWETGGALVVRVRRGDDTEIVVSAASQAMTENGWNQLAVTIDPTISAGVVLFVDGVQKATTGLGSFNIRAIEVGDVFGVGCSRNSTAICMGAIDLFEVFDGEFWTPEQVSQDFIKGYALRGAKF